MSCIDNPRKLLLTDSYLLPLYLIFLFILPTYLFCAPTGLYFAAPYSGEKVAEYEVTLPVTRSDNHLFRIPAECQAAQDALHNGANRWGNRVERSIWRKVQLDCDYVRFLHTFPLQPLHDYVSGYDFMNAELQDIPLWLNCDEATEKSSHSPACKDKLTLGLEDFSFFFPWIKDDVKPLKETTQTCRISNGIFRGRVIYDQTGVHCLQDSSEPGFRVIAIDYADVNGDDFLDAILRLIPLGRGVSRTPIVLPLTRKEPDGVFTIPQNLPGPLPTP